MEHLVKAKDKTDNSFMNLAPKFPTLSEAKVKESFIGPQIHELSRYSNLTLFCMARRRLCGKHSS